VDVTAQTQQTSVFTSTYLSSARHVVGTLGLKEVFNVEFLGENSAQERWKSFFTLLLAVGEKTTGFGS